MVLEHPDQREFDIMAQAKSPSVSDAEVDKALRKFMQGLKNGTPARWSSIRRFMKSPNR
jgi:hypothetical protein